MTLYASLDYTKAILGTVQQGVSVATLSDDKLMSNLRTVSARVDTLFGAKRSLFAPVQETRKFPVDGRHVNSMDNTFSLDSVLLALNGTVSLNGSSLTGVEVYPDSAMPPFSRLRLTDWAASWYDSCDSTGAPPLLSVPGIWGIHRDYAHAWLAVDTVQAQMLVGATTFTVAAAAGDDEFGIANRVSPGHLLKIDDEYLEVTAVSTNTITVRRHVNGTTAAQHEAAAVVYRWEVEDTIQRAVARQAGLQYARFGAYTTVEVQGMTEVRFPADWLHEALATLQDYVNG